MPAFSRGLVFAGSDPIRVAEQLNVTVPFYSGIAYSVGTLLTKHNAINRVVTSLRREPQLEAFGSEGEAAAEWIGEAKEELVMKAPSSES